MGYKLLGYAVWHGGKFYARRRYGYLVPSRTLVVAGVVGAGVLAFVVAGERNRSS
jgi:hypothetical protein